MDITLGGLELFMKAYLGRSPWVAESNLVPLPWREVELPTSLKIAIMWSDGVVKPHPPILRALRTAAEALQRASHTVMDWEPKQHAECWDITNGLYFEDGGERIRHLLAEGGETALPLTDWLLNENNIKPRTVQEVWELKAKRNAYRAMYNEHWLSTGSQDSHLVDAILAPVGPGCVPPHDQARYWGYTSQWNMLEYPAAVFPVSFVDPVLDKPDAAYTPTNPQDQFNHELYTGPERFKDAPISLQLITRRYEDEKCMAI